MKATYASFLRLGGLLVSSVAVVAVLGAGSHEAAAAPFTGIDAALDERHQDSLGTPPIPELLTIVPGGHKRGSVKARGSVKVHGSVSTKGRHDYGGRHNNDVGRHHNHPNYGNRHRGTNVRIHAGAYRPWARARYGSVIGGVALGSMIYAATRGIAPVAPAAGLCWNWSDASYSQGYWDYCQ